MFQRLRLQCPARCDHRLRHWRECPLASDVPESGTANPETAGEDSAQEQEETTYILNTSSRKFHLPNCSSVSNMKEENKSTYTGSREDLIEQGYDPCGQCKP